MNFQGKSCKALFTILMADDDSDDRFLMARAFQELDMDVGLRFVRDGEELMHYLLRRGKYAKSGSAPQPGLIFLDLNMPKKGGREVLVEIRTDPKLRELPVVVWTTSNHEEDMAFCLEAGASSFVTKPHSYTELLKAIRVVIIQWLPLAAR